jgi:hypothetical protein
MLFSFVSSFGWQLWEVAAEMQSQESRSVNGSRHTELSFDNRPMSTEFSRRVRLIPLGQDF